MFSCEAKKVKGREVMKQQLTWHSHAQPTKYFEYPPVEFPHARWIMFLQMSSLYKFKRGFCNYWYGSLVLHFTPMYLVHVGNVFFAKSRPIHPSGALVLCINPTFVVDKIIRCIICKSVPTIPFIQSNFTATPLWMFGWVIFFKNQPGEVISYQP